MHMIWIDDVMQVVCVLRATGACRVSQVPQAIAHLWRSRNEKVSQPENVLFAKQNVNRSNSDDSDSSRRKRHWMTRNVPYEGSMLCFHHFRVFSVWVLRILGETPHVTSCHTRIGWNRFCACNCHVKWVAWLPRQNLSATAATALPKSGLDLFFKRKAGAAGTFLVLRVQHTWCRWSPLRRQLLVENCRAIKNSMSKIPTFVQHTSEESEREETVPVCYPAEVADLLR